jgi:hypothetical protein
MIWLSVNLDFFMQNSSSEKTLLQTSVNLREDYHPTANVSNPTANVAAQINPTQQQRQQVLPQQSALSAQKKRVLPNKRM